MFDLLLAQMVQLSRQGKITKVEHPIILGDDPNVETGHRRVPQGEVDDPDSEQRKEQDDWEGTTSGVLDILARRR